MSGTFALIVSVGAAFLAVILFLVANSQSASENQKILQLLTICNLVMSIGNTYGIVAPNSGEYYLAQIFMHYGSINMFLCLLLFLCNVCDIRIRRWVILVLFCLNLVVCSLFSTNNIHHLIYERIEGEFDGMTFVPQFVYGTLFPFYVMLLVIYVMLLIGIVMATIFVRKRYLMKNRNIKINITWFILSGGLAVVTMVADELTNSPYDISNVMSVVTTFVLMVVSYRYPIYNMKSNTQEDILDELNDIIVVVDANEGYTFANRGGLTAFPELADVRQMMPVRGISDQLDTLLNRENGSVVAIGDNIYTCVRKKKEYGERIISEDIIWLRNITKEQKYITELEYLRNNLSQEVDIQTAEVLKRQEQLEQLSLQSIRTLADAIDSKVLYAKGHSARVAQYSVLLAKACGISGEELENVRYAALLHDVGDIGIPDNILNKPGKLTDAEQTIMKSHTVMGADILSNTSAIEGAAEVARHHHEWYDGSGYPDRLSGDEIPLVASIVAIADVYDAMNSRRSYRPALEPGKIRDELKKGSGKQFDPKLLDIFLKLLDNGVIHTEDTRDRSEGEKGIVSESGILLQKIFEQMANKDSDDEYDPITGLLTRGSAESKIAVAIGETPGAFIFLDVDNLKKINDTYGHEAGDRSLYYLGAILKEEKGAISCRLGGDEFLAFFPNLSYEDTEQKAKHIISEYMKSKEADFATRPASLSIGIVMTETDMLYDVVYNRADKALYHVKQNGKADYYFYRDEEQVQEISEINLELLKQGLTGSGTYNGAFDVDFRVFSKMYEYVRKFGKRYDLDFQLVLIRLDETDSDSVVPEEERDSAMNVMEQSIKDTIRNVDIYTRYGANRFLLILVQASADSMEKLTDRIFTKFYKNYNTGLFEASYEMAEEKV